MARFRITVLGAGIVGLWQANTLAYRGHDVRPVERTATPPFTNSASQPAGLAYALHPAFGEARVLSLDAGIRPAFADNLSRIVLDGETIRVNGVFRHGFLLAPVLAQAVADYLETGRREPKAPFSAPEPEARTI